MPTSIDKLDMRDVLKKLVDGQCLTSSELRKKLPYIAINCTLIQLLERGYITPVCTDDDTGKHGFMITPTGGDWFQGF